MKSIELNTNWNIVAADEERFSDLPCDLLVNAARDYSCALGEFNGYIPAQKATFTKKLPIIKHGKAALVISGACGYGDVFVNGDLVGQLTSHAPVTIDVTGMLAGPRNILRIDMFSAPGISDKYVGLGIGGGVKLVTEDAVDITDGSLFVTTSVSGDKTYADVELSVRNDGGEAAKLALECAVTNLRGKRCGKKQRKIYVRAHATKTFKVRVRLTKAYEWNPSDPYLYRLVAKIVSADGEEHSAVTRFGIVSRQLVSSRGLYINGKNTKLFGAYVSHADALTGGMSVYSNEKRRFEALKAIGYNAVHFVGCPTEAALDALDDVGMYAFVDIFESLVEGKAPLDGHMFNYCSDPAESVRALRNHPCVVMYGVADDVPECYDRHNGHAQIAEIAESIRSLDTTRPVTVSSREFVPTVKELDAAGVHRHLDSDAAAINAGREKDIFGTLTDGAFKSVDVCGFNYLYPLYSSDKIKYNRFLVGSRTDAERAFDSVEETEKCPNVIGDFADCGIDYPGSGKLNAVVTDSGDLDAICDEKTQAVYKRIILGARNVAHIAVLDPETGEPVPMWNWPRHLGQPVTVRVYTSGDVAALYIDGRLIGRKLAGKINKHIATFTTEYYPGTLETICYFKGIECARAQLKTAGTPKLIRLSAYSKNLSLSRGDIGFVHVDVCDRDGYPVPYAMRTLNVQVTGGKLIGFINGDPQLRKFAPDSCPAYNGCALAAVKPDADGKDGKVIVKITGDGLLASKISLKVKE